MDANERTKHDIWPLRVRITSANPYGLPIGKEFIYARRKRGDASPFPIEVFGDRVYQMREDEVEVLA